MTYGETAPDDNHGRQPDARLDLLDDEAVGDLADGHAGGGDGEDRVVVVAAHGEGLAKPGDVCIGKGGAVWGQDQVSSEFAIRRAGN